MVLKLTQSIACSQKHKGVVKKFMNFALVFIASSLSAAHLALIESWMDDHHIRFSIKPRWLSPHKAAEILVDDTPRPDQWASLKALLRPHHIDVLITPTTNRQKKLLLADMDSTIVTTETLDELSAALGQKERVSEITTRAMNGEINFHDALAERVALLKDLPVGVLDEVLRATRLHEGAVELISVMKHFGGIAILISSGFTHFTQGISDLVGFHHHHGNQFEIENGKLTGRVVLPVQDKHTKLELLHFYKDKMKITGEQIIAVGDGANDIPMLTHAGLGIGYYPKPLVAEAVSNTIEFTDLKSLLYIQGYSDEHIHHALHSSCKGHA